MPNPTQSVEIPFAGGLDTSIADRHAEPPTLLEAENVSYEQEGRLTKRRGYERLEVPLAGRDWVHGLPGGALTTMRDGEYRIYNERTFRFEDITGPFPTEAPKMTSRVTGGRGNPDAPVIGFTSAFAVSAFLDNEVIRYDVIDLSSGEKIDSSNLNAGGVSTMVATSAPEGMYLFFISERSTPEGDVVELKAAFWDATSTAPRQQGSLLRGDVRLDARKLGCDPVTPVCVYVVSTSGPTPPTIRTQVVSWDGTNVILVRDRTDAFEHGPLCVAVAAGSGKGTTLVGTTAGLTAYNWNALDLGGAAKVTLSSLGSIIHAGAVHVTGASEFACWYTWMRDSRRRLEDHNLVHVRYTDITTGTPSTSFRNTMQGLALASSPLLRGSRTYAPAVWANERDFERTLFIISETTSLAGRILLFASPGPRSDGSTPATVPGGGVYSFSALSNIRTLADTDIHRGGERVVSWVDIDFNAIQSIRPINTYDGVFIPGGVPKGNDGRGMFDHGLPASPALAVQPTVVTGGGLQQNATYVYQAIFQHVNSNGTVHWSQPSVAVTVRTEGPQNAARVTAISPPGYERYDAIIYRSAANLGEPLHLVGHTTNSVLIDTATDVSIQDNEIIYTAGGARLGRFMAPPCSVATVHDGRVWVVSDEDGSLWASLRMRPPEGIAFNPLLRIHAEVEGRRPVALASLSDERLLLLYEDRVAVVHGSGPDQGGNGSTYTEPVPVACPVGTSDPNSVVETHMGVLFRSSDGYWIVDQSAAAHKIGLPVQRYEKARCVGAVILPAQSEVAFVTQDGGLARTLFWNYERNRWSTQVLRPISTAPAQSVTRTGDRLTVLGRDGIFRAWDEDRYDHADVTAPMRVEVPWIRISGKQGRYWFQRLFILAEQFGPSGMRVEFAVNYRGFAESAVYTVGEMESADPLHMEVLPKTTDVEAVKIRFIELPQFANTSGWALDALRAEFALSSDVYSGIHEALRKGAA